MVGLCRILIAAMLTVHLTVGCCSHHAHGCKGTNRAFLAHDAVMPCGQCPESGGDHSQPGPRDCQGGKCSFVSSTRPASSTFAAPFQVSFAAFLGESPSLVSIRREQHSLTSGWLLLPVRLHLANQVLQI